MDDLEQETLAASVEIGRNALWNYVSLIVWIRRLRKYRILFNVLPIVFGGLSSWRIIADNQQASLSYLGGAMALVAGLLPLLYLASGIEDNIANATHLAGGYRVLESRVRDFVIRYGLFAPPLRETNYQRLFEEHIRLRAHAHTVPRWAFITAERLIKNGDYMPIGNGAMAGATRDASIEGPATKDSG